MLAFLLESAARSFALGFAVWIGLLLFRIRSPRDQFLALAALLLSALSMPLLMKGVESILEPRALSWIPAASPSFFLRPLPAAATSVESPVDWLGLLSVLYGVTVSLFLIRLAAGLLRSRRLLKSAIPLRDAWTQDADVRVSRELAIPATIGSTILLPFDCSNWDADTREAVLSHEAAHVRRRDFYAHLLAGVHLAVFWFSPLAWWLRSRLLSLAEAAADDEAIGKVKDRTFYAGLLVDFASRGAKVGFVGVEMARGGTVTHRVERLLGDNFRPEKSSFMKRFVPASAFIPLLLLTAAAWTVRAEQKTFLAKALPVSFQIQTSVPIPTPSPALAVQSAPAVQPQPPARQAEDSALSRWIELEVPDVANQQERDAFQRLGTDEERNEFIAMFWLRRDPTPGTAQNEFREEYYRRVAVANQRYTKTGTPGYRTDRGRILILLGESDEVETHAQGGTYVRDALGGRASTFPFERWRYRHIDGIGDNVILEFVDVNRDGNYRLEEFDPAAGAVLRVPGLPSSQSVAPDTPQK